MTFESSPYSFTSTRGLVTTAGVKRMFSSVCSPVYGGSFHGSLKSSGGRGVMPGFCVFGAGAGGVCEAAANANMTRAIVVRTIRLIERLNVAFTFDSSLGPWRAHYNVARGSAMSKMSDFKSMRVVLGALVFVATVSCSTADKSQ